MKLEDIKFLPRTDLSQHPRYPEFRRLIGLHDFAAYREVFERGWAETSILSGENVRLEELPLTLEPPRGSLLPNLMGVNDHTPRRIKLAKEFFYEYERMGRRDFMRQSAFKTAYVQDLLATVTDKCSERRGIRRTIALHNQKKQVQGKILRFLNVYENMKRFGTLVGQAGELHETPPPLSPADLPWAIDYCGYIKLRDGAHRRAAAHYLGWPTIPTLVFEFDNVTGGDLANAEPYIRDNFGWFAELVKQVAVCSPTVKTG